MIDPDDPLKDGLTPPDCDDSGENADDSQPSDEPNAGEGPLG